MVVLFPFSWKWRRVFREWYAWRQEQKPSVRTIGVVYGRFLLMKLNFQRLMNSACQYTSEYSFHCLQTNDTDAKSRGFNRLKISGVIIGFGRSWMWRRCFFWSCSNVSVAFLLLALCLLFLNALWRVTVTGVSNSMQYSSAGWFFGILGRLTSCSNSKPYKVSEIRQYWTEKSLVISAWEKYLQMPHHKVWKLYHKV